MIEDWTDERFQDYIRSKNLDIRIVEQCVSFLNDNEYCKENWWIKKEIIRFVHKENFSEIWKQVISELDKQRKVLE